MTSLKTAAKVEYCVWCLWNELLFLWELSWSHISLAADLTECDISSVCADLNSFDVDVNLQVYFSDSFLPFSLEG